ncbi:MAG TPA: DNA polymerase IV [Planctomycetota bacterium]|nr:DNA polymerase IV [Planctomycetota bacterium]
MDIDAFFASVEQLLVPRLRGRPVAVGSGCIASCSYEARRFGLRAGMSLGRARELCPGLVVLAGSHGVYRCFAARLWELCREVSPAVDTYLDDAYLDLAGMERLYASPEKAIGRLRGRIREETGLTVTAGIGPSRMVARLASKSAKPDGLRLVRPEEVEAFLVDRPAGDIPGVGPRTREMLGKLNIRTVRELRGLPRSALAALFGRTGEVIHDRARGIDTRAVSAREVPRTISRETTFHRETTDPAEVRAMLYYLVERAIKAVREMGLAAGCAGLRIRYADFKGDEGTKRLARPSDLEDDVFTAVQALLERLHTRRVALRLVGVSLSGLALKNAEQLDLFEPADESRHSLAEAVDAIRKLYGFSAITAGRSINLLGKLRQDANGYVLRTPSLTK